MKIGIIEAQSKGNPAAKMQNNNSPDQNQPKKRNITVRLTRMKT